MRKNGGSIDTALKLQFDEMRGLVPEDVTTVKKLQSLDIMVIHTDSNSTCQNGCECIIPTKKAARLCLLVPLNC